MTEREAADLAMRHELFFAWEKLFMEYPLAGVAPYEAARQMAAVDYEKLGD